MLKLKTFLRGSRLGWLVGLHVVSLASLSAFPPAPFHTLYGMVRDENGQTLRVDGAQVVFYKNGTEFLRQTISEGSQLDQNYQIRLRMDMLRSGTLSYSGLANITGAAFSIGILLHNVVYYPIEMSTSRVVGKPGERVRLDLTLGIDSDGDGIPDAWEESQLYAGGIMPGANGWNLALLDRNGDFDGDGIPNWNEYIAGTYATDATDFLALEIKETLVSNVRLQFFSIYGKVYSLESSTDLQTWSAASIYLSTPEPVSVPPAEPGDPVVIPPVPAPQASLSATTTGIVDIYAASSGTSRTFYRLKVR
jgi:hypothetical protein